jgi:hypothetical protein
VALAVRLQSIISAIESNLWADVGQEIVDALVCRGKHEIVVLTRRVRLLLQLPVLPIFTLTNVSRTFLLQRLLRA